MLHICAGNLYPLFYSAIVQANPTDELEERLHQMALPVPSLPYKGPVYSNHILNHYPVFIEYLQGSVRSLQYEPYL